MLNKIFNITAVALLFLTAVIPNSLQTATAVALIFSAALSIKKSQVIRNLSSIIKLYSLTVFITLIYLIIGVINGAPFTAVAQVLVIYIASPLLWIITADGILRHFSKDSLIKLLSWIAFMQILSVALFYFLYLNFGADYVSFFRKDPNLNLNDGYAGVTMNVFGPLIFISAAFFSTPYIIKNIPIRVVLLGGISVACITSGRSALLLSLAIGFISGTLFRPKLNTEKIKNRGLSIKNMVNIVYITISLLASAFLIQNLTEINLGLIINHHLEELLSGGGSARTEQAIALINGINETNGIGSGHGIGVSFIRSDVFPWRYELVWFATILRVGFLGALIYSLVFIYYVFSFLNKWTRNELNETDIFMFSGFLAAFIATNTNPYIEGFSMQWMYILPIVHFFSQRKYDKRYIYVA